MVRIERHYFCVGVCRFLEVPHLLQKSAEACERLDAVALEREGASISAKEFIVLLQRLQYAANFQGTLEVAWPQIGCPPQPRQCLIEALQRH